MRLCSTYFFYDGIITIWDVEQWELLEKSINTIITV